MYRPTNRHVTVESYVNRLNFAQSMLEKHPEQKEMLEKRIADAKEGIVQEVLKAYC